MTLTCIELEHAWSELIDHEWVWLIGMDDKKARFVARVVRIERLEGK